MSLLWLRAAQVSAPSYAIGPTGPSMPSVSQSTTCPRVSLTSAVTSSSHCTHSSSHPPSALQYALFGRSPPDCTTHELLHRSLSFALPSSHASPGCRYPSPHSASSHALVHASVLSASPSSHSSPGP